ncbi:MAG TPA: hypothetical protein VLF62_03565 [Candidatus Saccharimonadales bacterium]|nr:hypothetical protein [Candidatus Saccharimonadales bacterium]
MKFQGGISELGPVGDANDAHQAVGRWWASTVWLPLYGQEGAPDSANKFVRRISYEKAQSIRPVVERTIGGFALAVEYLSRTTDARIIKMDYYKPGISPPQLLLDAADMAGMPVHPDTTFPPKAITVIRNDIVVANQRDYENLQQVWPQQ